jgi:hypothetical protein
MSWPRIKASLLLVLVSATTACAASKPAAVLQVPAVRAAIHRPRFRSPRRAPPRRARGRATRPCKEPDLAADFGSRGMIRLPRDVWQRAHHPVFAAFCACVAKETRLLISISPNAGGTADALKRYVEGQPRQSAS